MQKNNENTFNYTLKQKLPAGTYKFKYIINDDWISGDNLDLTVPEKATLSTDEVKKLIVHLNTKDNPENYNLWAWSQLPFQNGKEYSFTKRDEYGVYQEIAYPQSTTQAGIIFKKGSGFDHKEYGDRLIDLKDDETHVWLKINDETVYPTKPESQDSQPPQPIQPTQSKTITVHFNNAGEQQWVLYLWDEGQKGKYYHFTDKDDFGDVVTVQLDPHVQKVGFLIKVPNEQDWTKNYADDRFVNVSAQHTEIWLRDEDETVYTKKPLTIQETPHIFTSLMIDDFQTLTLNLNKKLDISYLKDHYQLLINAQDKKDLVTEISGDHSRKIKFHLKEKINLNDEILLQAKPSEQEAQQKIQASIGAVVASPTFDELFSYEGELGAIYQKDETQFKLWAPTAKKVDLLIFDPDAAEAKERIPMEKQERGVWYAKRSGDHLGLIYMYDVHFINHINRSIDPYAKAVTVNGEKAVVSNALPSQVENPKSTAMQNPIIYELHVRDLSIQNSSGIQDKGKFNGLVQSNTKTSSGQMTGFDYIKSLGVTHIQLLPIFDYKTVDETKPLDSYNWGYDPLNYNAVEGQYATNPFDPFNRITELQQAIDKMHQAGLGVIMDVVYNHVFEPREHAFEKVVPGYYFRKDANGHYYNGTAVGNETASERKMVQKYMIDSLKYWAKTFKLDGFRFDLMGTHDIETMNKIYAELKQINPNIFILGEGWDINGGLIRERKAIQANANQLPNIAFFNDHLRDHVRGSVFENTGKGFATGNPYLEAHVMQSIKGAKSISDRPYMTAKSVIQYVEAHDNLTLWDKIQATNPSEDEATQLKRHKLASSIALLSHGVPFIHAGQEFARTKNGVHDSYHSPDEINQFDWARVEKLADHVDYFRELIKIRKRYSVFNQYDYQVIDEVLTELKKAEGLVAYSLKQDDKNTLFIAHNGSNESVDLDLPNGAYKVLIHDQKANHRGLAFIEIKNGKTAVKPLSTLMLVKGEINTDVSPDKEEYPVIKHHHEKSRLRMY